MIEFKEVRMKNFLSYGNVEQTMKLNENGVHLIIGDNRDVGNKGSSRNGVGKSSGVVAILYAIYGKGLAKISSDGYINVKNKKGLEVTLEFSKSGKDYTIIRKRKPNALTLLIDGVDVSLDSMSNTEKQIIDIIGMDYETFVLLYFLSPTKTSFMGMTGSEQRDVIESLLGLDILTQRAETLKLIGKECSSELALAERDLSHVKQYNEQMSRQVDELRAKSEKFLTERENKLAKIREELEATEQINFDGELDTLTKLDDLSGRLFEISSYMDKITNMILRNEGTISTNKDTIKSDMEYVESFDNRVSRHEETISDRKSKLSALREVLSEDDVQQVIDAFEANKLVKSKITTLETDKRREESNLERSERELGRLNGELDKVLSGTCYACGQDVHDDEMETSLRKSIGEVSNVIAEVESRIERIETEAGELKEQLHDITSGDVDDAKAHLREIHDIQQEIARLVDTEFVAPNTARIDKLRDENQELIDSNEELRKEYHEYSLDADIIRTEVASIEERILFETKRELEMYRVQHERNLVELEKIKLESDPFIEMIDKIEWSDENEVTSVVKELEKKDLHIKYLVKLLTNNKSFIRKNIIDMYIPFLNQKIQEHSRTLGLPHLVMINNDMSVDIEYMNSKLSYHNLSAGEKLRLDTATSVAFKTLVSTLGNGCNLMVVDELFDGSLDEDGMFSAFGLLKSECPNIKMISHRDEFKTLVDKTIVVVKENGFSRIES